eukprot:scaffold17591_cov16-Tisochrysis_lutea.AAC.1
MKNPEKLAASKKLPKYPVYEEGGRIIWIRPGQPVGSVCNATWEPETGEKCFACIVPQCSELKWGSSHAWTVALEGSTVPC